MGILGIVWRNFGRSARTRHPTDMPATPSPFRGLIEQDASLCTGCKACATVCAPKAISFNEVRDTGITWLALAGVDVAKMQRRAGHDEISTTMDYVKAAEDVTGTIGEPFPPLPACLVAPDAIEVEGARGRVPGDDHRLALRGDLLGGRVDVQVRLGAAAECRRRWARR